MDRATRPSPEKFLTILLLACPGIVLLLYGSLGAYARFIADDFCSFYFSQRLGMLRYVWHEYLTWGGRYSSFAVDSLIASIGTKGLPFVAAAVLVLWVVIATFMFHALLQGETGNRLSLVLALAMSLTTVFAVLAVSPRPQDTLYWWNGMRTYMPALLIAMLHVGFLYWAAQHLKNRRAIVLGSIISFFIALVNGGVNEPFSAVLILFFTGFTIFKLWTGQLRAQDPLFFFLVAAVLGDALALAIMLLSPGTEIRQALFPAHPPLLKVFAVTAAGSVQYIIDLLRSPQRLSALIAIFFISTWVGSSAQKKLSGGTWILLPIVAGILLSFTSLLPAVYATSELPAPRTMIVFSFIMVASALYTGLLVGKWLSTRAVAQPRLGSVLLLSTGVLILLSTVINARTLYASREVYSSFAWRWDQANVQILQAKNNGDESVTIPALNVWTGPGGDPTDNPRYWVNACTSRYYGLQVLGPPLDMSEPETQPNQ